MKIDYSFLVPSAKEYRAQTRLAVARWYAVITLVVFLLVAIFGVTLAQGDTFIQALTRIGPLMVSIGLAIGRVGELRSELRRIDG